MKKGKNLIISSIIILIISAMLTFGFFLEEIIKKEASNIEQNRFLEEISLIIKDLNFDKIEENLRVEKSRMAYPGIMPPKAPYKGRI